MSSVELELADELTRRIASLLDLPAKRQYLWILERDKLGSDLHVTVFPNSDALELADQESNEELIEINIVIQKAVDPANVEQVDGVLHTVRRLKDLWGTDGVLRDEPLAGCTWVSLANAPVWNPDRLLNQKEFFSVVTVGYRTDQ